MLDKLHQAYFVEVSRKGGSINTVHLVVNSNEVEGEPLDLARYLHFLLPSDQSALQIYLAGPCEVSPPANLAPSHSHPQEVLQSS